MSDRQTLMNDIHESSFGVLDLTLYLDTHPTDANALNLFEEYLHKRKTAMQKYEKEYGPLTVDCVKPDENNMSNTKANYADTRHFTWSDGPAPWEGGCL